MTTLDTRIANLPAAPSPKLTGKYMFIDSRRVAEDMRDLGYEVSDFRKPNTRTANGAYGLHEIEFRRPQDLRLSPTEAPRVIFMNSYDGTRKAQFLSGLIRFACSNGLVIGDHIQQHKFLHVGNYEEQLVEQLKVAGENAIKAFDKIEAYRDLRINEEIALEMATEALQLRYGGEDTPALDPMLLLQPRRREDLGMDLYTRWNVLQENILRGGLPIIDEGSVRYTQPVRNIEKSNRLNQGLWTLMEQFADA